MAFSLLHYNWNVNIGRIFIVRDILVSSFLIIVRCKKHRFSAELVGASRGQQITTFRPSGELSVHLCNPYCMMFSSSLAKRVENNVMLL